MTHRLLFAGILVAGAALRLGGLGGESLWHDESWTWFLVHDSLGELFGRLAHQDAHPPLYFLLLWPWAKLGDSEIMLRMPSALFGIAALPLLYRWGRRIAGPAQGLLAMAFVGAAPLPIKYSQEARSYALLFLFCVLSLDLLASFRERPGGGASDGKPRWIALGIVTAAVLYTEYLGAFFLLGEAVLITVWARRDRTLVAPALKAGLLAFLLFLPWLPTTYRHFFVVHGGFWMERTSMAVLGSELARLFAFPYGTVDTVRTLGSWAPIALCGTGLALAATLALSIVGFLRRPELRPWALAFAVPLLAMAAVGLAVPIFCARGLIYVLAPLMLIAAAGAERKWAAAVVLLVVGTLPGVRFFNRSLERENWRDSVAALEKGAVPGDLVLVHEDFLDVNRRYYWRAPGPVEIAPVGENKEEFAEAVAKARTRPRVWVLRRTYYSSPLLAALEGSFPKRHEEERRHVGLVLLSR